MYKIAYVEDEADLANLVCKYLKSENFLVTHFLTGEEAYSHMNEAFDLWILDIMLPGGLNGYDLIKKIREFNPKMPVIFTSARDQDIDRIMGLELGSDDYISKPFSIRELMLRVKNLLNRVYAQNSNNENIAVAIVQPGGDINEDYYVENADPNGIRAVLKNDTLNVLIPKSTYISKDTTIVEVDNCKEEQI